MDTKKELRDLKKRIEVLEIEVLMMELEGKD